MGRRYFWRLLLIAVIEFVIVLVGVLILIVPTVLIVSTPLILCCFPLCCGMIVVLIVFSFYMYLVRISVVADDADLGTAFARAWSVLQARVGPFIIFGLLLFGVSLVVGLATLVLALPAGIAFVGAFWPWIQNTGPLNLPVLYLALFFLLLFILLNWLIRSTLETWKYAVYALAYRQFAKPQAPTAPASILPSI